MTEFAVESMLERAGVSSSAAAERQPLARVCFVAKIKLLPKTKNMLLSPGYLCYSETRRLPAEARLLEVFC